MTRMNLSDEQKRELKAFIGFKSALGIFYNSQIVFGLLVLIGFACPPFSYNPTVLDVTKRTIKIMDAPFAIVGLLFFLAAIALSAFAAAVIQRGIVTGEKKAAAKKLVGIAVGVGISLFLSIVGIGVAYLFYEIPGAEFGQLELEFDAGSYLIAIGSLCTIALNVVFTVVAKKVLLGEIKSERLLFSAKQEGAKTAEAGTKPQSDTLEEKLTQLKRLRDAGVLTDEEFESKKKELLNNLQ